jgi:hypothetical protein
MGLPRQSEIEEQADDAVTIEGGPEAYEKVKKLLETVRKSREIEGNVDIVLAQHGKTVDDEDVVETFDFEQDSPIEDFAMAVVDRAEDDIEGHGTKSLKYVVRAEGHKARCVFTLKCDDGEEGDMDDIDDTPNRKGLMGLLMRHQQGTYKLSIVQAAKMIDALSATIEKKDELIDKLMSRSLENAKTYEELLSGKHLRDLELRKMENKDRRMDQLAGTVLQGVPLLMGKFLGGGAGAVAMQSAPGARTTMETLVEGFVGTLDSEQFQKIINSGLFSPIQIAGLVEIVKFIMEREEEEKKKAAAHANGQNGPQGQSANAQSPGTAGPSNQA